VAVQVLVLPPSTGELHDNVPPLPAPGALAVTTYWRTDEQALAAVLVPPPEPLQPQVNVLVLEATAVGVPAVQSPALGAVVDAATVVEHAPLIVASNVAVTVQLLVTAPVV
jgi:hypothetical protein